ncbi:uncharacterized protein LOC131228927 [Magnolia sinica]|uniref:uncharacterized protein LOC131228927 n=1 Tax=Magnolia sinica TaxID=86752 RepID=UPI00265AB3A7|nr:uncharacterized protein LOC131228927 [Magnolia sinica]
MPFILAIFRKFNPPPLPLMGNCASPPANRRRISQPSATVKVIHVDGTLQEFDQPIKAGHVTAQNPSCFLCSSESMHLGSHLPRVGEDEELQLGQFYFLMPHEISQNALSLPQLCELAVKVSAVLSKHAGLLSKNASCSRRAWSQIPGRFPAVM